MKPTTPTTPTNPATFETAHWKEVKASGENINDDDYVAMFDERPKYNDPPEPGLFKKIYTAISHSTVVKKISGFFRRIGEGLSNAASYVKSIFNKPEDQATALRNVREASDISDLMKKASEELIARPAAEGIPSSLLIKGSHGTLSEAGDAAATSGKTLAENQNNPTPASGTSSQSEANERAFKLWMSEFARDGDQAICQTNFEPAAKARAKEIYDAEVARCAACADKPGEYFLSTEDSKRLKAAAALLKKTVPLPGLMKQSPGAKVAPFSLNEVANFQAWRTWKGGGGLPDGGSISLELAVQFAEEFIATHNTPEDKSNQHIAKTLEDAFDLIARKEEYALKLAEASVDVASQTLLSSLSALTDEALSGDAGPPPPPPPRRRVAEQSSVSTTLSSTVAAERSLETTDPPRLPAFPPEANSLSLSIIKSTYRPNELRAIIQGARRYFTALAKGRKPLDDYKASAITLATLWSNAKTDREKELAMEELEFFNVLDELLQVEKIKADFR